MNLKKILFISIILISFSNCKSSKQTKTKSSKKATTYTKTKDANLKIDKIIDYAKQFEGVKYKYGGTTKKGMDCSGLIYVAFKENDVALPRVSTDMATSGQWVDLKKVKEGDLLFFATKKNSRKINHVGLVTSARLGNVEFIHSTTSKGVITSNLAERYWYFAFVQAKRIL
jgi:cell wall-associated NlpC family hydrolase